MSKVAVIGNTARAIGAVCASDLTLSGHEVRFTVFPEQGDQLPAVRKAGGFTVDLGSPRFRAQREEPVSVQPCRLKQQRVDLRLLECVHHRADTFR